MLIPLINRVADEPDPVSRVKELIKALRLAIPSVTFEQDAFLTELDDKAAFLAAAIVSGGHVHLMTVVFEGVGGSGD